MDYDRIKNAFSGSLKLWDLGKHQEAFQLLDDSITDAIGAGKTSWVSALSHHAAILSRQANNLPLRKHYYEQSLAHSPENARALYGLAEVALEEDQQDRAKDFAARCYRVILQSDDEVMKRGLLDLVLLRWPELAESTK